MQLWVSVDLLLVSPLFSNLLIQSLIIIVEECNVA